MRLLIVSSAITYPIRKYVTSVPISIGIAPCSVVEDVRDVMAIENTGQYNGLYHVLGGKISPIDGVGPNELTIASLVKKVKEGSVKEIIFALSNTMEGDTTNFYIYRQLEGLDITTSTIARGISVGDELEYTDEVTLGRSILHRIPFQVM